MTDAPARQPPPEFTTAEFEDRVERACALMAESELDGLVVTAEANVEYLSGFTTQFAWNTPTRPWYFLLGRDGTAIGVIPEIGESNWRATSWVTEVRSWPSPRPENEGLDLLADAIAGLERRSGLLGFELGPETRLGMPVADLLRLREMIHPYVMVDGSSVLRTLRLVKSPAEIARIRHICNIAGDAFDRLPQLAQPGDTERDVVRKFQAELILAGADKTPYTAIGSGPGGYDSIIQGPTDRALAVGDVFLIDTGARWGGYFCDFDRNVAIGPPADEARRMHAILWDATEAGIAAARPGNTAADVYHAQAHILETAGIVLGNVGRMGHGLGKVMTEPPSNKPGDETALVPGVVLTVEPSAMYGEGRIMAHEENLEVTADGPRLLTRRAPKDMPVAEW